jgi:hypothetical protein
MYGTELFSLLENRNYASFRRSMIRIGKLRRKGGIPEVAKSKSTCVQTMCVSAMSRVLVGALPVEESNSSAKHASNFARVGELELNRKKFNDLKSRRNRAVKKIAELRRKKKVLPCLECVMA